MLEIPLNREMAKPLYRQLADHLEKMILSGSLVPGERLPGSRPFSQSLGVSRMTVVESYHYLEDRGLIVQKGRSGAFVRSLISVAIDDALHVDNCKKLSMEGELPSPWLIPHKELSRLSKEILAKDGSDVLRGGPLEGTSELRKSLVYHAASRGIPASWKDVLVTSGGRQGLSVSFCALRSIGISKLLMNRLNYPDAKKLAESEGLMVDLFSDTDDLFSKLDMVDDECALYIVPSFANPTGLTMTFDVRRKLLDLCKKKRVWILEDDAYGELRYGHHSVPALRSLDDGLQTIYMGSFSQTLFPGVRLGYFILPRFLFDVFLASLSIRGGGASSLVQYISSRFILSGGLSDALDKVRMEMASRMDILSCQLTRVKNCFFVKPQGGIYLWLETPGISGADLSHRLEELDLLTAPGEKFDLSNGQMEALRLSVSDIETAKIESAVDKIERSIRP